VELRTGGWVVLRLAAIEIYQRYKLKALGLGLHQRPEWSYIAAMKSFKDLFER